MCSQLLKKACHALFRVVKKTYHLFFPRIKDYTYLVSVHVETVVELKLKETYCN